MDCGVIQWTFNGSFRIVFVFFFCSFVFFEFCILVVNRSYSYFCGADNPIRSIRSFRLVGVFGFFLRSSIFVVVVVVVHKIVLENVRPIADIVW